jgi:hypothetical protein
MIKIPYPNSNMTPDAKWTLLLDTFIGLKKKKELTLKVDHLNV